MTKRYFIITGILGYIFLIYWVYVNIVHVNYNYLGYNLINYSISMLLIVVIISLFPAVWIPIRLTRPSQISYWLIYVLVYIPTILIPYLTLKLNFSELLIFDIFILLSFWILFLFYRIPLISIPPITVKSEKFWIIITTINILISLVLIYLFKDNISVVSLNEVYSVRSEYKDVIAEQGHLFSYIITWQANVFNPLFISKGLVEKKIRPLLLGLIGQLIIYSFTGFKSILFSTFLLIGLLYAIRNKGKIFGVSMVIGTLVIIILSLILDLMLNNIIFVSLFVRRLIITPGLLSGYYYDFFLSHPHVLLSHSIFSSLVDYPYSLNPPYLIGEYYFGNSTMSANANFWADSFSNFGYLGIIIFTLILGVIFLIFDSVTHRKDIRVASLMMGLPSISLSNSALFTSLLTHGILVVILMGYLLPKIKDTDSPLPKE